MSCTFVWSASDFKLNTVIAQWQEKNNIFFIKNYTFVLRNEKRLKRKNIKVS